MQAKHLMPSKDSINTPSYGNGKMHDRVHHHPNMVYSLVTRVVTLVKVLGQSGKVLQHRDHRFEWTRQEFQGWAHGIAERLGYAVRFLPVGPEHSEFGPPTQMAVFQRKEDDHGRIP
jgi:hypothetical protein